MTPLLMKEAALAYERIVGLNVIDAAGYQRYRDAMTPLLVQAGGGFRYDFLIARTLSSPADHPINRVFAIEFPDRRACDAFFADPQYRRIRAEHFENAVRGATTIAAYDRP